MDKVDNSDAVSCKNCGEAFTLPEDESEGNLPRFLLCSHIFCTTCLTHIQSHGVIKCPECEVETTLPEGGVPCLQEDSRIIGLIYTTKMNKKKNQHRVQSRTRRKGPSSSSSSSPSSPTDVNGNNIGPEQAVDIEKIEQDLDQALAQAEENLEQLQQILKTLTTRLERDRVQLAAEIMEAADSAVQAVHTWKKDQLDQRESWFSSCHMTRQVQERIKVLRSAMQMAREVRRVPFLEQYCVLDQVLETLKAPVDKRSFNVTRGSGISCASHSKPLDHGLVLTLKLEIKSPKRFLLEFPARSSSRKSLLHRPGDRRTNSTSPRGRQVPSPKRGDRRSLRSNSPSPGRSSRSPGPRRRSSLPRRGSPGADVGAQDVMLGEFVGAGQQPGVAPPPSGAELINDRSRFRGRKKRQFVVSQWVVVSHIVNPSHFYIRYVAEKRERQFLFQKINNFCSGESSLFTPGDKVETGSVIFVTWRQQQWWRANVLEVFQRVSQRVSREKVKSCHITKLCSVRVFFLDGGFTKTITIPSDQASVEATLSFVNQHLRKVTQSVNVELRMFAPQAIRCALEDLVPYDPDKGWSREAQVEFQSVVGSATVMMNPMGQDRDSLLVDLKKAPMDQSNDVPISVREYLVFIEVARFYSAVTLSRSALQYYPPIHPSLNAELDAVVTHINHPDDFYLQLVENREFLLLSTKLQDCYTSAATQEDLTIYCPAIGQACVARYDNNQWYRAQVIGHPGGRRVEVRFVDHGDVQILSVSDVKKIKDEFFALPAMAIQCRLSDVAPLDGEETWSQSCSDRLSSLTLQKLLTIVATEKASRSKPLAVLMFLHENGQTSVNELLVREELLAFTDRSRCRAFTDDPSMWDPPLELNSASETVGSSEADIPQEDEDQELLDVQLKLKSLARVKDLRVKVSHVNSPSSFYVQLNQYQAQFTRMCELVKQQCSLSEPQEVAWKAEMFCAAHVNGVWERGRVCADVTSSNIAEVFRCDHGNEVKLHVSNLRPLPSSLEGSLALECTLTGIRPAGGGSTWTATACDLTSSYLTGVSALMTIKEVTEERPVPVTLLCSSRNGQFVSLSDLLASEGLALRERKPRDAAVQEAKETESPANTTQSRSPDDSSSDPRPQNVVIPFTSQTALNSTSCPPKPAPRRIQSAEMVKTKLYEPPELPGLGHVQMNVSAVADDGLIYTRTHNAGRQLERLRERIQQSMKALPNQKPYTWKSVHGCAVIGPDMLWYRGELQEVLGGHVKVQYVDYGLLENIPVVHVYPTLLCEDVPHLCMSCQLHQVHPIGGAWQREAVSLMREMLVDRCVDVVVMELPSDPRLPLTVALFLDGLDLRRILCHFQHATVEPDVALTGQTLLPPVSFLNVWDMDTQGLKDPEEPIPGPYVSPNLPENEQEFQVRVKHLWTPNELFLWPLEGTADVEVDGETLSDALTRINQNIVSLPRLSNFPRGSACLAEYSDGRYYRAKLMDVTSVEPVLVLVQHVDFGSYDTLPTSRLRQLPPELLRFPLQALKVKVWGLRAPREGVREDALPYSPHWSVKAVLDMIDLLENNVTTAAVVTREPELSVQLFNQDKELVYLPLVQSGLAELD